MNFLGVIPARAGSTRIPNKNLLLINGKTLTRLACEQSDISNISETVLTTDSPIIGAEANGTSVVYIERPPFLARNETTAYPPLLHAMRAMVSQFDYVVLLQPTSPLRTVDDINACIEKVAYASTPAVVSYNDETEKPNGAVYVGLAEWLYAGGCFDDVSAVTRYYMPAERSIDINVYSDYIAAKQYLELGL